MYDVSYNQRKLIYTDLYKLISVQFGHHDSCEQFLQHLLTLHKKTNNNTQLWFVALPLNVNWQ